MKIIKIQTKDDDSNLVKICLSEHIRAGSNDKLTQRPVDIMQYNGKVPSWPEDPVEYQQQLRSEWD